MSPDSNYKFSDVAKMNLSIAKDSERLRYSPYLQHQKKYNMPPPHASAMKARTIDYDDEKDTQTRSQRQHAERSCFFKQVTAKSTNR